MLVVSSRHSPLQLEPHVLDFRADIVDELAPAGDFFELEAVPVGVLLDGADALNEIVEVGGEVREVRFELGARLLKFWVGG